MTTAAVKSRTTAIGLAILNFAYPNWGDDANDNMRVIDGAMALVGAHMDGVWENSTAYVIGNIVMDAADNTLWRCIAGHTSPASPTTFAADRVANPGRWVTTNFGFTVRGQWSTGVVYAVNDIVYDTSQYVLAMCLVAHTAGAAIRTDQAAGKWVFIADLAAVIPNYLPISNDVTTLGIGTNRFAHLFLKSTGTINWFNGNYTITHSPGLLTFSGAVTITGNVTINGLLTAANQALGIKNVVQGRLTLQSGAAVPSADVSASATLYYTPYTGDEIALWDAANSRWKVQQFGETSISLASLAANKAYDVFGYINAGVFTLEISVAWTNDTTRAAALTTQNNVLVKAADIGKRYLGSFYTTTGTSADDTAVARNLWNMYNRQPRKLFRKDSTASWTYNVATIRYANNSASNRVTVMRGQREDVVDVSVFAYASQITAIATYFTLIGLDSNTAAAAEQINHAATIAVSSVGGSGARYCGDPGLGFHYLAWLEQGAASGTTTITGGTGANSSGLVGFCMA